MRKILVQEKKIVGQQMRHWRTNDGQAQLGPEVPFEEPETEFGTILPHSRGSRAGFLMAST